MKPTHLLLGILALGLVAFINLYLWPYEQPSPTNGERSGANLVDVVVPDLSAEAVKGRKVYEENCAACHGTDAAGQYGIAPPLVHKIYEPGHHGDIAFVIAAKNGVRAHHWPFGNMPPVDGITDGQITSIIAYVRELQRANGIF